MLGLDFFYFILSLSPLAHYVMVTCSIVIRNGKNSVSYKLWNFMASFLWMGFNCVKATTTSRRQFTFYHLVPRISWYWFYQPQKDERLSRHWSHPVVLNRGPLDWESSALTTRPLLHYDYVLSNKIAKLQIANCKSLNPFIVLNARSHLKHHL